MSFLLNMLTAEDGTLATVEGAKTPEEAIASMVTVAANVKVEPKRKVFLNLFRELPDGEFEQDKPWTKWKEVLLACGDNLHEAAVKAIKTL